MISSSNECNIDESIDSSIDYEEFQYAKYNEDGIPMTIYFDEILEEQTKETQYDLYWRYKKNEIDLWEVFKVAENVLDFSQDQAIGLAISCLVARDVPRDFFPFGDYCDWIMNNTHYVKILLDRHSHSSELIAYFNEALAHGTFHEQ